MLDAASVLGEIFSLLGWLATFLGGYGLALLVVTILLSGFVNVLSPWPRRANFLLSVAIVTLLALWQSVQSGRLEENLIRLMPYLIVVLGPLMLAELLGRLFGRRRIAGRDRHDAREDDVGPAWR